MSYIAMLPITKVNVFYSILTYIVPLYTGPNYSHTEDFHGLLCIGRRLITVLLTPTIQK